MKQHVPWNIKDILILLLSAIIFSIVIFVSLLLALSILHIQLTSNMKFAVFGVIAYLSLFFSIWKVVIQKYKKSFGLLGFNPVPAKTLWSMIPLAFILLILNFFVLTTTNYFLGEVKVNDNDLLLNPTLLPNEYIIVFIITVILAPITEELLFRGVLLGYLQNRFAKYISVVISAVIFGVLHIVFPPLFVLGLAFAIIRLRYNSLYPSIALHTMNNLIVFSLFLLGQYYH